MGGRAAGEQLESSWRAAGEQRDATGPSLQYTLCSIQGGRAETRNRSAACGSSKERPSREARTHRAQRLERQRRAWEAREAGEARARRLYGQMLCVRLQMGRMCRRIRGPSEARGLIDVSRRPAHPRAHVPAAQHREVFILHMRGPGVPAAQHRDAAPSRRAYKV